ncbi:MAG: T9SS type A sorting domain-containing protein [Bacteroidota bacterium]|nr:T9SS type A sorting domain-containing protein [Bacteroidota bacterium]
MKTFNYYLCVITLILIIQSDSYSQWSSDPNNPMIVCNEPTDQREPSMINDGSGGYFIFWTDIRNYGQNEADLYGQHLDAEGNKLWAPAGKKIADSVFYSIPKAIYTGSGNVIVLYSTYNGGNKLWAKKINSAGNSVWSSASAFFVAGWPQLGADTYSAVTDGSGGIIVTYQVTWGGGTTFVFAQRVTSAGILKWTPATNGLNLSVNGESRGPVITTDERGGAHIFWYNDNIWKTHIDSSGNFPPKTSLSFTPNGYPLIRAVSDGVGGAVIAWATTIIAASQTDIYAQRINLSGAVQWIATGNVVCNENGIQTSLNLTRTSDGNYIIVWADGRRVFVNNDVYGQKYNAAGNPLWTTNGVLVTNYNSFYPEPNLISDNSGGAYIFVFNTQTNFSVVRIKSDSTFSWTPNIRTLASSLYNPSYHRFQLVKNVDGAIVIWQTFNGTGVNGSGIFGANVNTNGTLSIRQVSSEIPASYILKQNYPNPFNPSTVISYQLAVSSFTSIKIYDVSGKEVATIVNEQQKPGAYEVDFDGSNFTSGVYFYNLVTDKFIETKKMILTK